jgi:hypothetical protein
MTYSQGLVLTDGQKGILHAELGVSLNNCKRPIIVLHGHSGDAAQGSQGGSLLDSGGHLRALARAGYAVLSIDAGGPADWGGPSTMTKIAAAIASPIVRTPVGIVGYSMNGLGSLNYIKRHASDVFACWLWEPVTDLSWANGANGTWSTEITAAYGSYAASAGYRVADEYSTWHGLGIPIKVVHASDDSVVPPSQSASFVTGVNDPKVTLRSPAPTGDHVGVFPNIPPSEMVAFFEQYA